MARTVDPATLFAKATELRRKLDKARGWQEELDKVNEDIAEMRSNPKMADAIAKAREAAKARIAALDDFLAE